MTRHRPKKKLPPSVEASVRRVLRAEAQRLLDARRTPEPVPNRGPRKQAEGGTVTGVL